MQYLDPAHRRYSTRMGAALGLCILGGFFALALLGEAVILLTAEPVTATIVEKRLGAREDYPGHYVYEQHIVCEFTRRSGEVVRRKIEIEDRERLKDLQVGEKLRLEYTSAMPYGLARFRGEGGPWRFAFATMLLGLAATSFFFARRLYRKALPDRAAALAEAERLSREGLPG